MKKLIVAMLTVSQLSSFAHASEAVKDSACLMNKECAINNSGLDSTKIASEIIGRVKNNAELKQELAEINKQLTSSSPEELNTAGVIALQTALNQAISARNSQVRKNRASQMHKAEIGIAAVAILAEVAIFSATVSDNSDAAALGAFARIMGTGAVLVGSGILFGIAEVATTALSPGQMDEAIDFLKK